MFLEQACDQFSLRNIGAILQEVWRTEVYLLFKGKQRQWIVSGQHSVWVGELEHLWVSVCYPGQEADTWRRAELEERRALWGQSPKPCLITVLALDLFSYKSQHPFFLWVNLGWLFITNSERHTEKAINRSTYWARCQQKSWNNQKWSVDSAVGSASHLPGTVLPRGKGQEMRQDLWSHWAYILAGAERLGGGHTFRKW